MKPKKRISKNDPSYYVPLPYAMALKRNIELDVLKIIAFEGKQLELRSYGVVDREIAVTTMFQGQEFVLGHVPRGMVSRIEGLMEHEESVVVTLASLECQRLKGSFWICFDELPSLKGMGFDSL